MKDQYAGDVGDFGKYGLLRALCRGDSEGPDLRLGVVWYLTPDDSRMDGGKTNYLDDARKDQYRGCDPHVYDRLQAIVSEDRRSIASVERDGVLPPDTLFYGEPLSFSGVPVAQRQSVRERWANNAYQEMAVAQLVFVDPDNGLAPKSWKPSRKAAPKHAPLSEIMPLMGHDRTVVIYHHLSRQETHPAQIERWLTHVTAMASAIPFALRFGRGSGRAFLIIPAPAHVRPLRDRAEALVAGQWGQRGHFDPRVYTS